MDEVSGRRGEAAAIRGKLFGGQIEQGPGGERIGAAAKAVGHDDGPVGQLQADLVPAFVEIDKAALNRMALKQSLRVLIELPGVIFAPFAAAGGFADEHDGFGRQIVGGGGKFGINKLEVFVGGVESEKTVDFLMVLPYCFQ